MVCYTQNRSIVNKVYGMTPYELWKGKKPVVSYFYTFGSKYFIHNNEKSHLKAFDERADEGLFMGYSAVNKAFWVLNKMTMVVEEFIHVVFDKGNVNREVGKLSERLDHLSIRMDNPAEPSKESERAEWVVDENNRVRDVKFESEEFTIRLPSELHQLEQLEVEATPIVHAVDEETPPTTFQPNLKWLRDHPQD